MRVGGDIARVDIADALSTDAARREVKRWQDSVAERFLPLTLRSTGTQFRLSARLGCAGTFRLAEVSTSAIRVERDTTLANRSDSDCFKLLFQTEGRSVINQRGASVALQPNEWVVYDATLPYRIECSDASCFIAVLLSAPNSAAWRWYMNRASLRVRQTRGNARLALNGMHAYLHGEIPFDDESVFGFDQSTYVLLDSVLRREAQESAAMGEGRSAALRLRAEQYVATHFNDPELRADRLAFALNVSRRKLYTVFEETGQTPHGLIVEQRLQAGRRALEETAQPDRNLFDLAVACGFSSASHFGRAFRQRFGCSPRAWRNAHLITGRASDRTINSE
ncbi:helix-turn-helix domain-containing protein [Burkholderia multivorans]|nr:helix-turn-helix domain-containing protein [Burkholderia multivorans]MBU9418094.1 helix-turn-helix domain-containing protein [Burkholderia multivorans]MBU9479608.1 helix-turn-helix domain-containing protein [Burkholderia multivorans]